MCNSLIQKQVSRRVLSEATTSFVFCTDRAAVHEVVLPCFSLSTLQRWVPWACINFLNRKKGTDWRLNMSFAVSISMGRSSALLGTYLTKRRICSCGEAAVPCLVSCFLYNTFVCTQGKFSFYFSCTALYWTGKRIVILQVLDITQKWFRKIFSLENIHCFDVVLKLSPQIHYNQTLAKTRMHCILQLTSCSFWT